jgi:hypothetical protein
MKYQGDSSGRGPRNLSPVNKEARNTSVPLCLPRCLDKAQFVLWGIRRQPRLRQQHWGQQVDSDKTKGNYKYDSANKYPGGALLTSWCNPTCLCNQHSHTSTGQVVPWSLLLAVTVINLVITHKRGTVESSTPAGLAESWDSRKKRRRSKRRLVNHQHLQLSVSGRKPFSPICHCQRRIDLLHHLFLPRTISRLPLAGNALCF